jgi:hypothetical protein
MTVSGTGASGAGVVSQLLLRRKVPVPEAFLAHDRLICRGNPHALRATPCARDRATAHVTALAIVDRPSWTGAAPDQVEPVLQLLGRLYPMLRWRAKAGR